MTSNQSDGNDHASHDPLAPPSRRISGMIDFMPNWARSAWVVAGFGVSAFLAFATVWPLFTRDPVLAPNPVNLAREARLQAMECRDAAFRYLKSNGVEKAAGQFRCAVANFERGITRGDGLSKIFLARLYADADAQHFLGKYSREDYLLRAGHLWCEAKAAGEEIAQGEPPFETDVSC